MCAQALRRAQKLPALHPGIGGRDASDGFCTETQRPLLPQEQDRRLRRRFRQQAGSVQHEDCAESLRGALCLHAAKRRFIGDLPAVKAALCGELQLRKTPAEHAAAAAAQAPQNGGIRIHADRKPRQKTAAAGKCTEKSLRSLHETLFVV